MSEQTWTPEVLGPRIERFLAPLLAAARLDLQFEVRGGEPEQRQGLISPDVVVTLDGRDVDLLLIYRGELLLALEQLTLEALGVAHNDRFRLVFDAQEYRMMRIEELRMSALAAAEKVKKSGIPFRFNPMTSRERRILHLALRDDNEVQTASEGVAPRRHTVIYSADQA